MIARIVFYSAYRTEARSSYRPPGSRRTCRSAALYLISYSVPGVIRIEFVVVGQASFHRTFTHGAAKAKSHVCSGSQCESVAL